MSREKDFKKVAFIYFTTLDFDTVFKTQVISWANIYREKGLEYQIVKAYSIKQALKGISRTNDKKQVRKLYNGPYKSRITYPDKVLPGRVLNFFLFFFLILPKLISGKRVVFLTRTVGFDKTLETLKKVFKRKFLIIYDSRAAGAEEYKYYNEPLNEQGKLRFKKSLSQENAMVKLADKVFCVSHMLKKYHIQQIQEIDNLKFTINPCNADENLFYFHEDERTQKREELGLTNKLVVVYAGGLQMKWHVPNLIFDAFSLVKQEFDNAFLLILSHDKEIAAQYAKKSGIEDKDFQSISLDNNQVRPYLSASDVGLLIRDNVIMNNVASPTKFAEYVMCGLPLIISEGVGDFSSLAVENQLGVKIDFQKGKDFKSHFKTYFENVNLERKKEISLWGRNNFSKQYQINTNLESFKDILNQ
jgi:hypothetical protein